LAHETQGVAGGDHPDVVARLGETAQQFTDLVGGDPAAHAENDPGCALTRHRRHRPFPRCSLSGFPPTATLSTAGPVRSGGVGSAAAGSRQLGTATPVPATRRSAVLP